MLLVFSGVDWRCIFYVEVFFVDEMFLVVNIV